MLIAQVSFCRASSLESTLKILRSRQGNRRAARRRKARSSAGDEQVPVRLAHGHGAFLGAEIQGFKEEELKPAICEVVTEPVLQLSEEMAKRLAFQSGQLEELLEHRRCSVYCIVRVFAILFDHYRWCKDRPVTYRTAVGLLCSQQTQAAL